MQAAETPHALNGIFDGLTGFSRVAVAVSGGSDSMALLRLVADWRDTELGPRAVFALTVDHGLRAESAAEAEQVGAWCKALDIAHKVLEWSGDKPTTGVQAKGRVARYDAMSDWCRTHEVPVLMTGHTADDQAETVVMRQKRTDSARSLAAIWPENEWRGIRVFRPLLKQRRLALRGYLLDLGQTWLEDPSNHNNKYERVRIRAELAGQDIVALQSVASQAQHHVRAADLALLEWRMRCVVVDDYAVIRFPRAEFCAAQIDLRHDIMAWSLEVAGSGEFAERAAVQSIADWISNQGESRRSANGAIVSARRHVVEVMREPSRVSGRFVTVGVEGCVSFDNRFLVTAPLGTQVGAVGLPPLLKRPKDVPALAFSAAPVVKFADGTLVSAVKSGLMSVSTTLCERFRS